MCGDNTTVTARVTRGWGHPRTRGDHIIDRTASGRLERPPRTRRDHVNIVMPGKAAAGPPLRAGTTQSEVRPGQRREDPPVRAGTTTASRDAVVLSRGPPASAGTHFACPPPGTTPRTRGDHTGSPPPTRAPSGPSPARAGTTSRSRFPASYRRDHPRTRWDHATSRTCWRADAGPPLPHVRGPQGGGRRAPSAPGTTPARAGPCTTPTPHRAARGTTPAHGGHQFISFDEFVGMGPPPAHAGITRAGRRDRLASGEPRSESDMACLEPGTALACARPGSLLAFREARRALRPHVCLGCPGRSAWRPGCASCR